jgi:hypothetical protein
MADRWELEQLRALARKRHKAATRKISRLNHAKDVEISGSKFDPRRDLAGLKRYNKAQIMKYIQRLDSFLERGNQFVGDAQKRPIPAKEWQQYKQTERRYNAGVTDLYSDIKNVRLPDGRTIDERQRTIKADHPLAGNPSVKVPHSPVVREPWNIASPDKLKGLIKDLKYKMTPAYDKKQLAQDREELKKIMAVIKDPELEATINSLSAKQFNVLWNYTTFATAASLMYEIIQAQLTKHDQAWHAKEIRDSFEEATNLVGWAKTIS